jgi:F-type H+-transporting ATPase subunit alpha
MLKQTQYNPMGFEHQAAIVYAAINGALDIIATDRVRDWEDGFHRFLKAQKKDLMDSIREKKALEPDIEAGLKTAIAEYQQSFA